jgi:hypothetical protein
MTLLDRNMPQHKATTADAAGLFLNSVTRYFARHRLVLYLLLGAGIVAALELAGRSGIASPRGVSAVHDDDVHVHEARHQITEAIRMRH